METIFKKAIENELIRKPSKGFSNKVMTQIFEMKGKVVIQPLIPKEIWIGLFAIFMTVFGVSVLIKPQTDVISKLEFFDEIEKFVSTIPFPQFDFFTNVNLLIISGVCLALFLLLFFDLVLFKRK